MMEYFTYKKGKKGQADKEKGKTQVQEQEHPEPLLSPEDENFLGRIISAEGTPPPLPDRPSFILNPEAGDSRGNDLQMVLHDGTAETDIDEPRKSSSHERKKSSSNERRKSGSHEEKKSSKHESKKSLDKGKGKGKEKDKKSSVFSFFQKKNKDGLDPKKDVSKPEAEQEKEDISRLLDNLNLSATNNRTFSLSAGSQNLVKQFTVVLKDLVNGVPTAYDDLVALLNDSQGTLAKSYEHLPSYLQKLIRTLPTKLTGTLVPEVVAVATDAQMHLNGGERVESADNSGGLKGAAKGLVGSVGLRELVTKPGAVVRLLKAIMNALKLRWPAFMGTNVLLSLALFVLLFVFWYCHKRGRETRLEREGQPLVVDSEGRIIELEDDPMLPSHSQHTSPQHNPSQSLPSPRQTPQLPNEGMNGVEIEGGISGPSTRHRKEDTSGSGRSKSDTRRRLSKRGRDDDRKENRR